MTNDYAHMRGRCVSGVRIATIMRGFAVPYSITELSTCKLERKTLPVTKNYGWAISFVRPLLAVDPHC